MRRLSLPDPLALLTGCVLAAAILTWIVPARQYDRRPDAAAHRIVVVPGTLHDVAARPAGPFEAMLAVPHGLIDAAAVVFFVFLVGGALTVVEETGALRHAVGRLVVALRGRGTLLIPVVSIAFAAAGALENMQEEIIALVPVLLLVTRQLGFDPITAVAISIGASAVGAAFSPLNPFQVQIAQRIARLPLLSGWPFRSAALAIALAVWIAFTWRDAVRRRGASVPEDPIAAASHDGEIPGTPARRTVVLLLVLVTFAVFVYGVIRLGWDFDQMAALFFAMGIVAGLVGGLGVAGTAKGFTSGFAAMAYSAMLIGFARAIFVVLDDGRVIDTIVGGVVTPLQHLPVAACAVGMMAVQALMHVPVPSVSGQAVLTMPLMVPVSDLIGLQRQAAVLAYQYGAGLTELVTPTNGAIVAVAAAAGVKFGDWLSFAWRAYLTLLALAAAILIVAVAIGLK